MKRIMLPLVVMAIAAQVHAQAPHAIPYQAAARNSSGVAIATQPVGVRFTIHDGDAAGPVVYSETHMPTTTAQGLFSVQIGQGIPASGTFATINWGTGAKYLQVEIDPAGGTTYTDMGTTQLMSVPYALYAETTGSGGDGSHWAATETNIRNTNTGSVVIGSSETPPAAKLHVMGSTALGEGSIASGANSVAMAGGQAVGDNSIAGYNSTTIGIGSVSLGGGGAHGNNSVVLANGLTETAAEGASAFTLGIASAPYSTAIGRSVLLGGVSSSSFGNSSVALAGGMAYGTDAVAIGNDGYVTQSRAYGNGALAMGGGLAGETGSFAFGGNGQALGANTVALNGNAYGEWSTAISHGTTGTDAYAATALSGGEANGARSLAVGGMGAAQHSMANGMASTALGCGQADGLLSVAIGAANISTYGSFAPGDYATAIGGGRASGEYSIAIGYNQATSFPSQASGVSAVAIGGGQAEGNGSVAIGAGIGAYASAVGDNSVAIGQGLANGNRSFAMNFGNASGEGSFAWSGIASGFGAISMGGTATGDGSYSFAGDATGNFSMALGQGSTAGGHNSMALMGGTTSGTQSIAMNLGSVTGVDAYNSLAITQGEAYGEHSFAANGGTASGSHAVAIGGGQAIGEHSMSLKGGTADASESVTIGGGWAQGNSSIVIGNGWVYPGATGTILIGGGQAGGENAIAIHNGHTTGASSVAIGTDVGLDWSQSAISSGANSVAIGAHIKTIHEGSFAFGDHSSNPSYDVTETTADNQMMMRFAGGYKLYTNAEATLGAEMAAGGNSWSTISDRRKKENFAAIDGEAFLKKIAGFKLTSWNYKGQNPATHRHYGPMAQDFYAAFGHDGYGTIGNDTTINQADMEGVTFTAVQALEKRTQEIVVLKAEIEKLKNENRDLKASVTDLSATLRTEVEQLRAEIQAGKVSRK